MIFVNFKTYGQAVGENSPNLFKIIKEVSSSTLVQIVPVVQLIDATKILSATTLAVWSQYLEKSAEQLAAMGIKGTFLNHSDHKYQKWDELGRDVENCKKAGLTTMVFAEDIDELKRVLKLKPDFAAYEPKSLIGSTTTSVVEENSSVIKAAYEAVKEVGVGLIVGAGIHNGVEVKKSLELGAVGVAVATDIVKADDPKKKLLDLVGGF